MTPVSKLKSLVSIFVLLASMSSTHVYAGPYADDLGKALVARTTSSEKVVLVRWLFIAMSLHPEVKGLATISDQQREEANRAVAKMIERLLTDTCAVEAREAVKYEGASAIERSFQLFGEVAGRELFSNPAVAVGAAEMGKYLNADKMKKAFDLDNAAGSAK